MSPATSHPDGTYGDGDDDRPPSTPTPPAPPPAPGAEPVGVEVPPEPPVGPYGSGPSDGPAPFGYPVVPPLGGGSPAGPRLRDVGVNVAALLVLILLGIPFGLVWSAVSPGVPVVQTENGALLAAPQPEEFIAADGWFSVLGFGLGVLATIAMWLVLRRHRGPVGMLVAVLGMLGAAVLAWQLGRHIGLSGYERLLASAPPGERFNKPPDLHGGQYDLLLGFVPTIGGLLVPAFGAAVMYTLLAGWSRYPGLRPEPEPTFRPGFEPAFGPQAGPAFAPATWPETEPASRSLSSDLPVPPAPPGAPAPPVPDATEPPRD